MVLISFHSFYFLFCSVAVISTLSSSSLICSFASFILLLISSSVFSFQLLFISVCSLFLLGHCSIFLVSSWSVPLFSFLDLRASSLSLLWILFWVDCLSQLHLVVLLGFCLAPPFRTHLLSHFVFLWLWFPFHRLQWYSSSCLWYLPTGGWGWFRDLWRPHGGRDWCLPTGAGAGPFASGRHGHVKRCV